MSDEGLQSQRTNFVKILAVSFTDQLQKMINQQRNIITTISKRRYVQLYYPKTVIKIFAKTIAGDFISRFLLVAAMILTLTGIT